MSTTVIPTNNLEKNSFIIMNQVMPAQPAPSGTGQNVPALGAGFFNRPLSRTRGLDQDQNTAARRFRKREPKVLGTVQIMIGLMSFMFSNVLMHEINMLLMFTRSFHGYWGSAIFIFAGLLSVVAANKYSPQLVKVMLVVNAISAVAAGTAVGLHSLDIAYTAHWPVNSLFMINGTSGVLLVFSLLQFIISICMFLFGLDVTFYAEPMVCTGSQFPGHQTCCSLNTPFRMHSNENDMFVISNPNLENLMIAPPPPYNETVPQFQQ